MVSFAIWILSTAFVIALVLNIGSLLLLAAVSMADWFGQLRTRWNLQYAEKHMRKKRQALGY